MSAKFQQHDRHSWKTKKLVNRATRRAARVATKKLIYAANNG